MRVGIIGGGKIARIQGPLILRQPNIELVGIADEDLVRAKSIATELKAASVYQDAKHMISEQRPDVVHVLTPPQYHAQLSIMAMNEGCHVLVEKPMALTMADAKLMVAVAKKNDVCLCVDHNMSFERVLQKAIELCSRGAVGELVSIDAHQVYDARRNSAFIADGAEHTHWSYRLNGGPLQDLVPHPASLVAEFISDIQEVYSIGINRGVLPNPWHDEINVLIKSSGILAHISVSLSERPETISLVIKGTRGILHADIYNSILTVRKQSTLPRAVCRGITGFQLALQYFTGSVENIYNFALGRIDSSGGIGPVISRFYEAVRNKGEAPTPLDKSLRVVELLTRIWPQPVVRNAERSTLPGHAKKTHVTPSVLVTGAGGFVGSHLVERLLAQHVRLRALVRPNSVHIGRLKRLAVETVAGDLIDARAVDKATKGVEIIYHLGAAVNNDWEDNCQSTLKGTDHLIRAALTHRVEKFVHVSTTAVYNLLDVKTGAKITEESECINNSQEMGAHAYAKMEAEKLVLNAYQERGLRATIVRPGMVVGPRGNIFFPHLGYRYRTKVFLVIGRGDRVLPLTYIENTVDGLYRASIETNAIGQIFNIIDDGQITVREYLQNFAQVTGLQTKILTLPYVVAFTSTVAYEMAAFAGLLKKGATSRKQLRSKQAQVQYDNTKAKTVLGWKPHIPIDEGLIKTFQWYANEFLSQS